MIRLGFVVPRYGPDVLGGAETAARQLAEHLPSPEFDVSVLTTCARDLVTWRNEYPAGESSINGVRVLRFPIARRQRDGRVFEELTDRANRGEPINPDEQSIWLERSPHSPKLYLHLARRGAEFDLLVFMPYLFGTTMFGSALWPHKSVICPCLHNEPYAYFVDVRLMLQDVRGLMFISPPEQALAEQKLGIRHPAARLVGIGIDGFQPDGQRFRQKFSVDEPFVLFAGRLDPLKNLMQLFSFFQTYRERRLDRDLKLILAGEGPLPIPDHPDIRGVGYLARDDLRDAYAAATVLCQPSLVESFSIVLMEAWLAGSPVLVNGDCDVTRYHVSKSNGGLYFTSAAEFAETIDWFLDHPKGCQQMGLLGRSYVQREYNWSITLRRFSEALKGWLEG